MKYIDKNYSNRQIHLGLVARCEKNDKYGLLYGFREPPYDGVRKIHENNRGRHRSEEVRKKISQSRLGQKRGPWTDAERKAHMEANEKRRQAKASIASI